MVVSLWLFVKQMSKLTKKEIDLVHKYIYRFDDYVNGAEYYSRLVDNLHALARSLGYEWHKQLPDSIQSFEMLYHHYYGSKDGNLNEKLNQSSGFKLKIISTEKELYQKGYL
jgi:hypothetical protein